MTFWGNDGPSQIWLGPRWSGPRWEIWTDPQTNAETAAIGEPKPTADMTKLSLDFPENLKYSI